MQLIFNSKLQNADLYIWINIDATWNLSHVTPVNFWNLVDKLFLALISYSISLFGLELRILLQFP